MCLMYLLSIYVGMCLCLSFSFLFPVIIQLICWYWWWPGGRMYDVIYFNVWSDIICTAAKLLHETAAYPHPGFLSCLFLPWFRPTYLGMIWILGLMGVPSHSIEPKQKVFLSFMMEHVKTVFQAECQNSPYSQAHVRDEYFKRPFIQNIWNKSKQSVILSVK